MVVSGRTKEEHDARLCRVLNQAQRTGLKLNKSKCQFGVREITYLGDRLSEEGVQPDRKKKSRQSKKCPNQETRKTYKEP